MVMPRSRSMSIRSRYCARAARSSTTPVSCSIRSASVDLPWSMCAMMQKFRMIAGSVRPGTGAAAFRDTDCFPEGTVRRAPILPRRRGGSNSPVASRRRSAPSSAACGRAGPPAPRRWRSITRREARLSTSQVSSARSMPPSCGLGQHGGEHRGGVSLAAPAAAYVVPDVAAPLAAARSSARGAARSGRRTPRPRSTTSSSGRRKPGPPRADGLVAASPATYAAKPSSVCQVSPNRARSQPIIESSPARPSSTNSSMAARKERWKRTCGTGQLGHARSLAIDVPGPQRVSVG